MMIRTDSCFLALAEHSFDPQGALSQASIGDDQDLLADADPGVDGADTLQNPKQCAPNLGRMHRPARAASASTFPATESLSRLARRSPSR
jgi:hypothetical protein